MGAFCFTLIKKNNKKSYICNISVIKKNLVLLSSGRSFLCNVFLGDDCIAPRAENLSTSVSSCYVT